MTEENKGAAVELPEPDGFMDQSLGGFPAYSADAMLTFRAEGEAELRALVDKERALSDEQILGCFAQKVGKNKTDYMLRVGRFSQFGQARSLWAFPK